MLLFFLEAISSIVSVPEIQRARKRARSAKKKSSFNHLAHPLVLEVNKSLACVQPPSPLQQKGAQTTTTSTKTSLKKRIRAASNFIALIPSLLIRQMLANFYGVEFYRIVSKFRKRKRKLLFCVPVLEKREIRHYHVVVVQRRLRNAQKSVMHVQSSYFANLNLLGFCRSRCRRRRLGSLKKSEEGAGAAVHRV